MKLVLSPLAVLTLTAALSAQLTLLDDFASATDVLWQRTDRLAGTGLGTTLYTFPSGRYRIATSQPLPALPQAVATGSAWLDSTINPGSYARGRLQVKVRFDNDATNALVITRYDLVSLTGYGFALNNFENRIYISTLSGTAAPTLASTPFALVSNTDYLMAIESVDSRHALKVWLAGSPEPALPQLTAVNGTFTSGVVGLVVYNQASNLGGTGGQLSAQFDDVYYTPYAMATGYGTGCPGSWNATPTLGVSGQPTGGGTFSLDLAQGPPGSLAALLVGFLQTSYPLGACTLLVDPGTSISLILPTNGAGAAQQSLQIPLGYPGIVLETQCFVLDGSSSFAATAGLELIFP